MNLGTGLPNDVGHQRVLTYRRRGGEQVVEEQTIEIMLRHPNDFVTRLVNDDFLQATYLAFDLDGHSVAGMYQPLSMVGTRVKGRSVGSCPI